MKKTICVMLVCLVFIVLTACTNKNEPLNTTLNEIVKSTSESQHTDDLIKINAVLKEHDIRQTVMKAAGVSQPFIFDITHEVDVHAISIWIDKYENGQFVEQIRGITAYTANTDRNATIYVSPRKLENNVLDWTISIQQGEGHSLSSGNFITEQSSFSFMGASTLQDISTSLNIDTSIGYIAFNNKSSMIIGLDDQSNIQEEHELLYIIKCRLE